MRILVVEDEPRMAALIRQGLEEEAYAVDVVDNGRDVLLWLQSAAYDIVLLDIMLPGMNGLDVCRQLRSEGYNMPVLMLTARDTLPDKVKGLDSGADDYLVKPFAIEELTARMRALARRDNPDKRAILSVADLTLDPATKLARRGGSAIELTAKEYALLETLMRHPNQILSRDQIIEHVWDMEFDSGSKLIEVYIYTLRKKIDAGHDAKLIQTVRGLGYRIGNYEAD
ncbi:MAG: response regulator transcription factor [Ardenticatenaceae bacterium]|nr:response regulator transcription factor [Anaerolineales bacterium]MCB8938546.1 response regulator transcription factor [Ardenticatenaceae bacterium]MCB8973679.1 response regulator transcription factor [Ardenticatenaceae bacterium]